MTKEEKQYKADTKKYLRRQKQVIEADKLILSEAELSLKYCIQRAALLRKQISLIKKSMK